MDYANIILRIIGSKKNRELFENNIGKKILIKKIIGSSGGSHMRLRLPNWANAWRLILLVQLSSAASE